MKWKVYVKSIRKNPRNNKIEEMVVMIIAKLNFSFRSKTALPGKISHKIDLQLLEVLIKTSIFSIIFTPTSQNRPECVNE